MKWFPKLSGINTEIAQNYDKNIKTSFCSFVGTDAGHEFDKLKDISKILDVSAQAARDIRSIPDIYYKAQLLNTVFDGESAQGQAKDEHFAAIRAEVEYEWQAMLAVLVLSKSIGIDIRTVPFFPKQNKIDWARVIESVNLEKYRQGDAGSISNLSPLERILVKALPRETPWKAELFDGYSWDSAVLYVMVYKNSKGEEQAVPLAHSSPCTIVVPAANAWDAIWKAYGRDVPWIKMFVPGIQNVRLPHDSPIALMKKECPQHIPLLRAWLQAFRQFVKLQAENVSYCPKEKQQDAARLYDNDSFLARFDTALHPEPVRQFPGVDEADLPNVLGIHNIASLIAIPQFDSATDVTISAYPKVLWIDTDKESIAGRKPKEIIVLDGRNLEQVRTEHKKPHSEWLEKMRAKGYTFLFSDELFLEKVLCLQSKVAPYLCSSCVDLRVAMPTKDGKGTLFIPMPLREQGMNLLKLFGGAVTYSIKTENPDQSIEVNISVATRDRSGSLISYESSKIYEKSEKSTEIIYVPASKLDMLPLSQCGVWPRQPLVTKQATQDGKTTERSAWTNYYVISMEKGVDKNSGEHAYRFVPNDDIKREETHEISKTEEIFSRKAHYYVLDTFPTELKVVAGSGKTIGYVPLTPERKIVEMEDKTYAVSLDFGTSSTVLYKRIGGNNIEKFNITGENANLGSASVWYLPDTPETVFGGEETDYFVDYFVPHNDKVDIGTPFQSLLFDLIPTMYTNPRQHLIDARVFHKIYAPDRRDPNYHPNKISTKGEVRSDLKWNSDNVAMMQRLQSIFLHLAKLIALDALYNECNTLKVIASYPGAMADPDTYLGYLQTQVLNILKGGGASCTDYLELKGGELIRITEGQAAAQFFYNGYSEFEIRHTRQEVCCIIDIGGGSTDFFIWEKADGTSYRAIQSSIKFGARDMLVDVLKKDAEPIAKALSKATANRKQLIEQSTLYQLLACPTIQVAGLDTLSEFISGKKDKEATRTHGMAESVVAYANSLTDFPANFEALLSSFPVSPDTKEKLDRSIGDFLPQALAFAGHLSEKQKRFLTVLALGAAATVYYAGMLARTFETKQEIFDLKFSGNGSKVLNWMQTASGAEDMKKFLGIIFKTALLQDGKANGMDVKIREYDSTGKWNKHEAALGMFGGFELDLVGKRAENITLAGEPFKNKEGSYLSTENIYRETDEKGERIARAERDALLVKKKVSQGVSAFDGGIGNEEFIRFICAYNAAISKTYGDDGKLLPIEYPPEKIAGSEIAEIASLNNFYPVQWNDWRIDRETELDTYIKSIVDKREAVRDRMSFFMLELRALKNQMIEELNSHAN